MVTTDQFWLGRRVLVTGHTGFKGAWLAIMLERLGARVYGIALDPRPEGSLFAATCLDTIVEGDVRCDIRDERTVRQAVKTSRPEIIFHLAAQSLVLPSYAEPLETFATNIMGTANLLKAASDTPSVRGILVVTTDKVYENQEEGRRFTESDALGGHDPYSASKAAAEILAASWRHSFAAKRVPALAIATARSGNVIGGGDWAPYRLLPDCVRAFGENRPVRLRNPESVRPWQHVLDPLSGYISLAEKLAGNRGTDWAEAWNFGPATGESFSVKEMARLAAATWGGGAPVACDGDEGKHFEARTLYLDATKANQRLGWEARWGAARAVVETISWYRDVAAGADARSRCLDQMEAHRGGT